MKFLYVVLLVVAVVAAEEKYSSENDDFNIDEAVAHTDTLTSLVKCFLDTAPCDAVSGDFKKDIPEATKTICAKCTDAQKHIFHKFLEGLKAKLPQEYEAFKTKYDPENKFFSSLEAAVAQS